MVLVEPETTGGEFSVIEASISAGIPGPPPHIHTDGLEEIWYILDGELDFLVGDETIRAGKGATVYVPAGSVHTFSNPSDTNGARWIGIFRPGGGLKMLEELADVMPADGPPDMDRMMATFVAHGVELVGPPPS